MNTAVERVIQEVAAATLERLAFVFATPLDGPAPQAPPEPMAARVKFHGPFQGAMELEMPGPAVDEMAVNMLGMEEGFQPSPEERRDAIKELINVICGNVLPRIAGESAEFNLGAPCLVGAAAPGDPGEGRATAQSRLMLDSGICTVTLRVQGALPRDGGPGAAR
jgi:hypothetical protein